jgi:hypothetical protein
LAQLLDFGFFLLSGRCGLFHSFILPAFATEVFFDLNPYSKSLNGITIQLYTSLIAYLILQLISIPAQWGNKLLDKIRYIQACMCQKISFVHWCEELMFC